MHPDAVWEHNLGSGSPEEGVYQGREAIRRLFERISRAGSTCARCPPTIRELEAGVYLVRGELHCKHRPRRTRSSTQYEQRMEIRDGLLSKRG